MKGFIVLKRIIAWFAVAVWLTGAADAGPLEDGYVAFESRDYKMAVEMWRLAADKGETEAQFNLGNMYTIGQGVPENQAEAAKWFRIAADRGHAPAQHVLGFMYYVGRGLPKDHAEAAKWNRRAANQGYALAQNLLGILYAEGDGVSKDEVLAYVWFNLAAAQGNREAAKNRDRAAKYLTPTEVAEAQRLSREWKPAD